MDSRWPRSIEGDEIEAAYPEFVTEHCSSCHEDVDYGFTEAIEPVVVRFPDGTLGTHWDSCCAFIKSLRNAKVPISRDFDLDGFEWKEDGGDE